MVLVVFIVILLPNPPKNLGMLFVFLPSIPRSQVDQEREKQLKRPLGADMQIILVCLGQIQWGSSGWVLSFF